MKTAIIWRMAGGLVLGLALSAGAADWYVATSGNDAAAGSSWAEAKATIQAGVDAAAVGDTVWVSNGVYDTGGGRAGIGTWPNRVTIDKAITVRSVNGAEATRIVGSGMRCAYVAEGATLMGFMLTNGVTTAEFTPANFPKNMYGGGAYCAGGVLEECILTGNWARYFGGGAFGGTLNHCLLRGNRAGSSGGGAHGSTLNNCLIVGNTALYGSGAIQAVLTHCTVVGNTGAAYGIGMCMATNSIVWSNGVNFTSSTFAFSCTSPDPGGTGNITDDPQFADAGAEDYRLAADSPCIGAGDNGQANWATDLDGNPRIDNGLVDMGVYEVQGNLLSILPGRMEVSGRASVGQQIEVRACANWSASSSVPWLSITSGSAGTTNGAVQFNVETFPFGGDVRTGAVVVSGGGLSLTCTVVQVGISPILSVAPARIHLSSEGIDGQAVHVMANLPWTATANEAWLDIRSGESGTDKGQVEFSAEAYSALEGARTGTVVIAGGGLVRTCTVVQAGTWWQPRTWHVATNGNDEADGTSWATAKATIQAGVDAAAEGDTVWVSNGVYDTGGGRAGIGTWPNRVTIDKAITVRSVNGLEATRIVGSGMRCAYVAPGATLIGFMLTNGVTTAEFTPANFPENMYGGGAYCVGGVLQQCILVGNQARCFGGAAFGGTLNHCILRGNQAGMSGGGSHGSTLNNCLIVGNDGSGATGGTLTHCTVAGNTGEGLSLGTANNCILWSNGVNFSSSTFAFSCTSPDPGGIGNITNNPQFVDAGAGDYRLAADSPCIGAGDNGQANWATDLDGNPRIDNELVDMGAYEVQGNLLSILPGRVDVGDQASVGHRIEVQACANWSASSSVPWLSIMSGSEGTTNGTVQFNVATNPVVGGARTGTVVVACGGYARNCMVVQAGSMAVLAVTPAIIQLPIAPTTGQRIDVTANMPWTAAPNVSWLEITSGASGTTNGQVVFSVAENLSQTNSRTGRVVVTGGGVARTCTVIQARSQLSSWYVAKDGDDDADGTTWETAKATIQVAVDVAAEGDTVWVSNGVYDTGGGRAACGEWPNRVSIYKAITVRSVNGAQVTHILGNGMRCVFVTNGATLMGFTLAGGTTTNRFTPITASSADMDGGGALCLGAGTLVRCVLTQNSAYFSGGGVRGGILNHCILSGNSAGTFGGGSSGSTLNNCLLLGNTRGGAIGGTLNNCTVVGNKDSVAVYRCTVNNSIVYYNEPNLGQGLNDRCTFTSSCTTPDPGGSGNITNDPQFVDAAAGDYRLQASSPCIDAGDNGFVGWNEDMDGNQRIAYGLVDMGAYEAQLTEAGSWFGAIANGLTNDLDCAAGDQTPNLMKYAMGGSPRQPQDRMFVGGMLTNGSGPKLTFLRNRNATDVRFIVESAESMTNGAHWRGVATNEDGSWGGATNVEESGTGNPVECTVTAPEAGTTNCFLRLRVLRSAWDKGYADLGDGWRRLDWFGDYIPTGAGGWIWHNRLGTLRVTAASTPDDIWMYADGLGWLWTSRTQFPNLFRKSDEAWLWYNGSTNPRWFMNFSTGQWERWP